MRGGKHDFPFFLSIGKNVKERTENPDLLAVYGRLLAGSKNHLNAFVRNIEAVTGETYVAQRISQKEVDEFMGR